MDQKNIETVKQTTNELLEWLKTPSEITIEADETETIFINIHGEDLGILIGYHGETLNALQLVLALMLYKKSGKWQQVVVDVGDWKKRREDSIKNMALSIAEKVRTTQKPMSLPYLTAAERRIVHILISEQSDLLSESQGEGPSRKLIIKPKE